VLGLALLNGYVMDRGNALESDYERADQPSVFFTAELELDRSTLIKCLSAESPGGFNVLSSFVGRREHCAQAVLRSNNQKAETLRQNRNN
jgi:hypothetical protein